MKHVMNMKDCTIEKVSSITLYVVGTIFLLLALFVAWKYYFTMSICYAAAILVREEEKDISKK